MKKLLILFLFTSTSLNAQWTFNVVDSGALQSETPLLFPVTYKHDLCNFKYSLLDNGDFVDVVVNNNAGCSGLDHFLVIDDFYYTLPADFQFEMFGDAWQIFDFVDMGTCSTISANPILGASPNIFVGGNFIQINDEDKINVYAHDSKTYFEFTSENGDVFCTNGNAFISPLDLIYKGGFE